MTDSLPGLVGSALGVMLIGCLIFFGRDQLRNLGRGISKGIDEFKKATAQVWEEMSCTIFGETDKPDPPMNFNVMVWIAQGFGVGRIPFAPGTFGSVVGLLWFALLLWPGNLWFLVGGIIVGVLVSVWFCGAAEKALNQKDPSSVVLDEIAA
ncbi:MAG TPA: phosphatidylglycerophosphatase A, partial [Candidatus Binatia bacterium]|nr:phosphatidylglycerophosphatase A [Candidatus Binatia bacterium]